jgi:hypothetical protein
MAERTRRIAIIAHAKRIAHRFEGITGVDFGFIYKDGKRTKKRGIRFHVASKRHSEEVPDSQRLPDELHGLECDVLQAVYKAHADLATGISVQLSPGLSIGNLPRRATGTLGMIVTDSQTNQPCVLSNWHVLAGSTAAGIGDDIVQPGPASLGPADPANKVAELLRWTNLDHGYDAALGRITGGITFSNRNGDANVELVSTVEPTLGMRLVKSGLSSRFTHAVVDGIDGSYPIDYSAFGDTTRWMDGVHLVPDPRSKEDEITLDGDSGAIWFQEESGHAVALNFSGEDGLGPLAEYALAHRLSRVLDLLNARVP